MTEQLQQRERPTADQPVEPSGKPRPTGRFYAPRVNVLETANELLLCAELPGVRPEDVTLNCKGDELVLHARCGARHEGKRLIHAEYGVGDFFRAFRIADDVETGEIEATLTDGVLTVRLPRAERARPKQITVTGGSR
jgi:HSP20 family molecular chaperone IbpA